MKVLVTGAAGFIGMHCAKRLLARGDEVVGVDNLSPYYAVKLKRDRLKAIAHQDFRLHELDIADGVSFGRLYEETKPDLVLHLAAQPGVRYSLTNPAAYVQANLVGFANVLECCRRHPPRHLVFASSSSVYGNNARLPWTETKLRMPDRTGKAGFIALWDINDHGNLPPRAAIKGPTSRLLGPGGVAINPKDGEVYAVDGGSNGVFTYLVPEFFRDWKKR